MPAYYNENDPYVAEWLENLIRRGLVAPGDVDRRSIVDVAPSDLRGYGQHHFFAGIGGWSYALRLAGWPDDRPIWTGSCPCQPFSSAGAKRGSDDGRHLWPSWFRLIRECRPGTIVGEQIAGGHGRAWLDHVLSDLEIAGYAAAAADLPACGVGAPHRRQRLYWMADAEGLRLARNGGTTRREDQRGTPERRGDVPRGPWENLEWIECTDGKRRAIKPGIVPLAHGIPGRVGRLRAYGNAIVPQVAAAFLHALLTLERTNDEPTRP